jgi:hypothetical protein
MTDAMDYVNPYRALGWTGRADEQPARDAVHRHVERVVAALGLDPKVRVDGADRSVTLQDVHWCEGELADERRSKVHWWVLKHPLVMDYLSHGNVPDWKQLADDLIGSDDQTKDILDPYLKQEYAARIVSRLKANDVSAVQRLTDLLQALPERCRAEWADAAVTLLKAKYVDPIVDCCSRALQGPDAASLKEVQADLLKLCSCKSVMALPKSLQELRNKASEEVRRTGVALQRGGQNDISVIRWFTNLAAAMGPDGAVAAIVEKDLRSLQEMQEARERMLSGYLTDLTFGGRRKDHFALTVDRLVYNAHSVLLSEIASVSGGGETMYSNGYETGQSWLILVGTSKKTISIECRKNADTREEASQRFRTILDRILGAVGPRLISEACSQLDGGGETRFGEILLDKAGMILPEIDGFGTKWRPPVHVPWHEIHTRSSNGHIVLWSINDPSRMAALPYRETDNWFVLTEILRQHGVYVA